MIVEQPHTDQYPLFQKQIMPDTSFWLWVSGAAVSVAKRTRLPAQTWAKTQPSDQTWAKTQPVDQRWTKDQPDDQTWSVT